MATQAVSDVPDETVPSPVLEFDEVRVTYAGPVPAVRGVTLSLAPGEILGIAGESGCGKSTLASTVLRLQPASASVTGEIRFQGQNVAAMKWSEVRAMRWAGASMIFQGALHALNPVRRVGDQIAEAIRTHDRSISEADLSHRVGGLLEEVGLPRTRARQYPHELSGGQRQRVMIAMALACGPELIIADEPTTALDVMVQEQVLSLLRELVRERSLSLVFISHDLSVLGSLCDRIAVMYAGKVVELGTAEQIFGAPRHPYAGALSAAFPRIGDRAARYAPAGLPGDPPDVTDLPPGCAFAPRCARRVEECDGAEPELRPLDGVEVACLRPLERTGGESR
jgi:peptide/nickel transport system ATP-binding protein